MSEEDRCHACIMAAWLGDATGSILEFKGRPAKSDLEHSFSLPGGGIAKLGPGQITDDGELTCCLLQGLIAGNSKLDLNLIANKYGQWIESRPFDLGSTLRKSFPKACRMTSHQAEMVRRGAKLAQTSQSNGCLMRISPLAVWCRHLSLEETVTAVKQEVMLSHPNETVQWACVFYVIAIGFLLKSGLRQESFDNTKAFLAGKTNQEFWTWVEMIQDPYASLPVNKAVGWAKIAFVHGFKFLLAGLDYHTSLCEVMKQGGDTDTNACIVGALIGAADGMHALSQSSIAKLMEWQPSKGGIKRPKWLRVSFNACLIPDLIRISPTSLQMLGHSDSYRQSNPNKCK